MLGLRWISFGLAALALGLGSLACAPASEEDVTEDELTLDDASKFVVSATAERIVLQKEVDDEAFPVAAADLLGKVLIIHPIKGRAEGGVVSWARKVRDTGEQLVVTGEPLDFDDLMQLDGDPRAEDRIVRIYLDEKLPSVDKARNTANPSGAVGPASLVSSSLAPATLDLGLDLGIKPQSWSGVLTGDYPQVWVWAELTKRGSAFASVSEFHSDGFKTKFNTTFGVDRGRVDLGFSGTADWKISFRLNAIAGGRETLFETKQITLLERAGFIPIAGVIPVPAMLRIYAYSGCYAVGGLKFDGTVTAGVHIAASASVRFAAREGAPESWIEQGSIPNSLEVVPSISADGIAPSAGIICHVGRVNADLEIGRICRGPRETCGGMVIAPYLGLVPQAFFSDGRFIGQEPGMKAYLAASLRFGAWGRLFGKGVSAEIDLLRWAPDKLPAEAR